MANQLFLWKVQKLHQGHLTVRRFVRLSRPVFVGLDGLEIVPYTVFLTPFFLRGMSAFALLLTSADLQQARTKGDQSWNAIF